MRRKQRRTTVAGGAGEHHRAHDLFAQRNQCDRTGEAGDERGDNADGRITMTQRTTFAQLCDEKKSELQGGGKRKKLQSATAERQRARHLCDAPAGSWAARENSRPATEPGDRKDRQHG
jgi:hypothetical protein